MRVLIIQLARMGDLFQSVPVCRHFEQVWVLHNEVFTSVVEAAELGTPLGVDLSRLLPLNQKSLYYRNLLTQIDNLKFDLVVNLNSSGIARQISQDIHIPEKAGFGSGETASQDWLHFAMSFVKTRRLSTLNLIDIYRHTVEAAPPPRLKTISPAPRIIAFQVASRNSKRQWSADSWRNLAKRFIKEGCRIILLGVESERQEIESVFSTLKSPLLENQIGKTSISELLSLLADADLLVTGDTGTMHAATYASTPVVAIFTASAYSQETLCWGGIALQPDMTEFPCYPCADSEPCPRQLACHNSVSADDVWNAVSGTATPANMWLPEYDSIGQYLTPAATEPDGIDLFMAFAYRSFALKYFWGETQAPLLQPKEDWLCSLKRELKLLNELEKLPWEHLVLNFELLKPLVYIKQLTNSPTLYSGLRLFLESLTKKERP